MNLPRIQFLIDSVFAAVFFCSMGAVYLMLLYR